MKRSKSTIHCNRIGLMFFLLSAIMFVVSSIFSEANHFLLTIGFFALCLFWIIGIQHDLYKKENEEK